MVALNSKQAVVKVVGICVGTGQGCGTSASPTLRLHEPYYYYLSKSLDNLDKYKPPNLHLFVTIKRL